MSEITLELATKCMESLCGTLNDNDNECLQILIDEVITNKVVVETLELELAKVTARYNCVRDMTPEDFGNLSTINDDFDRKIDELIKERSK